MKKILLTVLLIVCLATAALAAEVSTDKMDYVENETVYISGTGFLSETNVDIVVYRPDGANVTFATTTDTNGDFNNVEYFLDAENAMEGEYDLFATDGTNTAYNFFTDCGARKKIWNLTKYICDGEVCEIAYLYERYNKFPFKVENQYIQNISKGQTVKVVYWHRYYQALKRGFGVFHDNSTFNPNPVEGCVTIANKQAGTTSQVSCYINPETELEEIYTSLYIQKRFLCIKWWELVITEKEYIVPEMTVIGAIAAIGIVGYMYMRKKQKQQQQMQ